MSELDQLERELRKLNPAPPPEQFMARLDDALPVGSPVPQSLPRSRAASPAWWRAVRWWIPATAVAAVAIGFLTWKMSAPMTKVPGDLRAPLAANGLKADDVEIDERLLGSFEAVGQLPDGEPVRFRCREWEDGVVLRDSVRGIEIERRKPRLEIVRVSFETY